MGDDVQHLFRGDDGGGGLVRIHSDGGKPSTIAAVAPLDQGLNQGLGATPGRDADPVVGEPGHVDAVRRNRFGQRLHEGIVAAVAGARSLAGAPLERNAD